MTRERPGTRTDDQTEIPGFSPFMDDEEDEYDRERDRRSWVENFGT